MDKERKETLRKTGLALILFPGMCLSVFLYSLGLWGYCVPPQVDVRMYGLLQPQRLVPKTRGSTGLLRSCNVPALVPDRGFV